MEIRNNLTINIYGCGAVAANRDYVATIFKLNGNMWDIVKRNSLKNKGLNIWVYEANHGVFAGVELEETPPANIGLVLKQIILEKYAWYKHTGPYKLLPQAYTLFRDEIKKAGLKSALPNIEIYGHWTANENESVTELLMALQ